MATNRVFARSVVEEYCNAELVANSLGARESASYALVAVMCPSDIYRVKVES